MNRPVARVQYRRQTDMFVATRSGGGGFIHFGDFYRSWNWVMRNCVCAICRGGISNRKCKVPADGLIPGATYFVCASPERHVIRREADLRWEIGAQARDERHRAQGKVRDVLDAYEWLGSAEIPSDDQQLDELPI